MTFWQGLLAGRSQLAFLIGLTAAFGIAWAVDASTARPSHAAVIDFNTALPIKRGKVPKQRRTGVPLTDEERQGAKAAWRYFENNYQAETGLVNSVDAYPSATLWDLASYMMGMLAAEQLEVIGKTTFTTRMDALLKSLSALSLVENVVPNRAYNTQTLGLVDYTSKEAQKGVGWSALDIARIGVPFTLLVWSHPEYTERLRLLLARWKFDELFANGQMIGAQRRADGSLERTQEGRFGYEQYAAKSFFLLGYELNRSMRYDLDVEVTEVSGQPIAYDSRLPDKHGGAHNAVVSEPYILEAIEFGFTDTTLPLARALYAAQRARFEDTRIVTAVSEDNIDRAPYFIYGSVLNDMKPWSTFAPDGTPANDARALSVKAALGWAYLFDDAYAKTLLRQVSKAYDAEKGWYSGKYEANGAINKALTANTNGIVLEIFLYKVKGPLMKSVARASQH